MALHDQIQAVIDNESGARPALANNHLKGVLADMEKHADVITPEVFATLMNETQAQLSLPTNDRIKDLKTVFKIRDLVAAHIQSQNAAPATTTPAAVVTPEVVAEVVAEVVETAETVPVVEEAAVPVAAAGGLGALAGLVDDVASSGTLPATEASEDDSDVIDTTAETVVAPAVETTPLLTTQKSAVLSSTKVTNTATVTAEAPPAAPPAAPADAAEVITEGLIQMPSDDAAAGTDTGISETGSALTKLAANKGSGRKGAAPISDIDALLGQLADKVEGLQKELTKVTAERDALKANAEETSKAKVSPTTLARLQKIGITP